jgi:hypothetical protein
MKLVSSHYQHLEEFEGFVNTLLLDVISIQWEIYMPLVLALYGGQKVSAEYL